MPHGISYPAVFLKLHCPLCCYSNMRCTDSHSFSTRHFPGRGEGGMYAGLVPSLLFGLCLSVMFSKWIKKLLFKKLYICVLVPPRAPYPLFLLSFSLWHSLISDILHTWCNLWHTPYVAHSLSPPPQSKSHEGRNFCLLCSLLYLQASSSLKGGTQKEENQFLFEESIILTVLLIP